MHAHFSNNYNLESGTVAANSNIHRRIIIVETWTRRILLVLLLVAMLVLVRVIASRRRHREAKWRQRGQYEPCCIWSHAKLTFIWCICANFVWIVMSIPRICRYAMTLKAAALFYPHMFLSFYQLARLKASFNHHPNKSTHRLTAGLAYPNSVYIVLYVIGALQSISLFVVPLTKSITQMTRDRHAPVLVYFHQFRERPYDSGCWYLRNVEILSYLVWFLVLFAWSWCIVVLYAYKLYRVETRFRHTSRRRTWFGGLRKKQLSLTMVTQITVIFVLASSRIPFMIDLSSIAVAVDICVVFGALCLMLDENEKDGRKLLRWLRKRRYI